MRARAVILTIGLTLAGCANQYVPGPYATSPPGVASGQCKLMALGGGSSGGAVYASGSPRFVGTYTGAIVAAGVIGSAAQQAAIYNACMEAAGYVPAVAEGDVPAVPVATSAVTR